MATAAISQDLERHVSAIIVVLDIYPQMMREMIINSYPPVAIAPLVQNVTSDESHPFTRSLNAFDKKNIGKLNTEGYSRCDVSLLYKLIRHFGLVETPTRQWGNTPSPGDFNRGDDVERMKRNRNDIFHRPRGKLSEDEKHTFFQESEGIAQRIDDLIGRPANGFEYRIQSLKIYSVTREKYIQILEKYNDLQEQFQKISENVHVDLYYENDIAAKFEPENVEEPNGSHTTDDNLSTKKEIIDMPLLMSPTTLNAPDKVEDVRTDTRLEVIVHNTERGNALSASTVLEEWEAKDHMIVETTAMEWVRQHLKVSSCVTITGHSGSGKSTVMRHIALELKTQENYEVYPSFYPSEIKHHFDIHKKQVFVFDDVFGKYALNLHILDDWIFLMREIKDFILCDNIKIVLTCRTHIANDVRFGKIKWLTVPCCDIQQHPLIRKVRDEIARRHGTDVIRLTDDDVRSRDLFPLLCETYRKLKEMNMKNADLENFFKCPFEVLEKIFQNIKETEKISFALLALFVICNNVIEESMFVTKNFKDKCRSITKHCGIDNFSTEDIKSRFIELQKYFTKISGTKYKIFHDKIFDAVVFFYGNEMFDVILENAHSDIIRERFHFESLNIDSEIGFLITVPADKEKKYFKRLFIDTNSEILNNEITLTAFANRQLQYPAYREKFMNYCKENEELKQQILLLSFKATSPLLEVSAQGYEDVLEMLIEMDLNVNACDEKGDTSLHKASALANLPCVKLLLRKGADANRLNMSGESAFFKASQEGDDQIAAELIKSEGVDKSINLTNNARETPLYVSCRGGHYLMARFLINEGADPLKFDEYLGSPLHVSSRENHTEIIEMLR